MTSQPQQPPPKPTETGPNDPPGIAASILPERQRDASRHPDGHAPDDAFAADDAAAAAQQAVETKPQPPGGN